MSDLRRMRKFENVGIFIVLRRKTGIRLQVQGVSQNRILKVIMELPEEKEPEDNPEKDSEKEK